MPEYEEGSRTASYYEALEEESFLATGLITEKELKTRGRWRPAAHITVWDNVKKVERPLVECQVRFRSGIRSYTGWTDSNGNRSCDKRYVGKCRYSLKFEYRDNKWDIRNGRSPQAFLNGPNQKGNWNTCLDDSREAFFASIYIFAREHYKTFSNELKRKSIRAHDKSGDDGWQKIYGLGDNWTDVYRFKPNSENRNTAEIFAATIGSLGALQYFNKNDKSSQSFSRLFQYAIGDIINRKYNYDHNALGDQQRTGNLNKSLFIDLMDDFNQNNISSSYPKDRVTGFTLEEVFNASTFRTQSSFIKPSWVLSDQEKNERLITYLKAYNKTSESKLNELMSQY